MATKEKDDGDITQINPNTASVRPYATKESDDDATDINMNVYQKSDNKTEQSNNNETQEKEEI